MVAALDPEWGASLLGDKAHPLVFDNSKIKSLVPGWEATVPFWRGAREIIAWHDADASRRLVDREIDATIDQLIAQFHPGRLVPGAGCRRRAGCLAVRRGAGRADGAVDRQLAPGDGPVTPPERVFPRIVALMPSERQPTRAFVAVCDQPGQGGYGDLGGCP